MGRVPFLFSHRITNAAPMPTASRGEAMSHKVTNHTSAPREATAEREQAREPTVTIDDFAVPTAGGAPRMRVCQHSKVYVCPTKHSSASLMDFRGTCDSH